MVQEMASGFSLFEKALLDFVTWDLNLEQYTKVAAAIENAVHHYRDIYDKTKTRAATSISLDHCFKGVDAIGSSRTYVVSVRCE